MVKYKSKLEVGDVNGPKGVPDKEVKMNERKNNK